MNFEAIRQAIIEDADNVAMRAQGTTWAHERSAT
jgi:hypothetical protein